MEVPMTKIGVCIATLLLIACQQRAANEPASPTPAAAATPSADPDVEASEAPAAARVELAIRYCIP
ncbi:MAG: hypothetical protein AAF721_42135 [Myxococcota bacterium]